MKVKDRDRYRDREPDEQWRDSADKETERQSGRETEGES
jgi:hypothetical protein